MRKRKRFARPKKKASQPAANFSLGSFSRKKIVFPKILPSLLKSCNRACIQHFQRLYLFPTIFFLHPLFPSSLPLLLSFPLDGESKWEREGERHRGREREREKEPERDTNKTNTYTYIKFIYLELGVLIKNIQPFV